MSETKCNVGAPDSCGETAIADVLYFVQQDQDSELFAGSCACKQHIHAFSRSPEYEVVEIIPYHSNNGE